MLLGVPLTLLVGPTVALPAPPPLLDALESVEVDHNDEGRSGFQLTFQIGRASSADVVDYPLLVNPLVRQFSRVIVVVTFNAMPRVLMDGIITHSQLSPGNEPGAGTLTVTGEDVSVMMDLQQKSVEHIAQDETIIANKIILNYPQYGLTPLVIPPFTFDQPIPIQRTPVQTTTDLSYLQEMAQRHGYVFYVIPGPALFTNTAYWGPPIRAGVPQRALSVNLGPETNVESINFQYNALAPTTVSAQVQDSLTNQKMPVRTFASLRAPLTTQPALIVNQPNVRNTDLGEMQGLSYLQAFGRAQAMTDRSVDNVVTASGTLDAIRYANLLQPRALVGLRGVGYSYDGMYYVKRVSHTIRRGEYKQNITLTRDGVGSTLPVVKP